MVLKVGLIASVPSVAFGLALGFATGAIAQVEGIEEIVVVGDPLKLIEKQASDTVFGLNKSYLETPRSISVVSDATIDRYSIETVNDLIVTTPGTFTGSFFGVPGSPTIRGGRADTYYKGFKRIENPGTFPMPIGASERIEIVRGPTPVNYGAGRIGGLLNFVPHTEKTARQSTGLGLTGSLSATYGSYDKRIVSSDLGVPLSLGGREGGLYAYAELEDSRSYYKGIEPERALIQVTFEQQLGDDTRLEVGGMAYRSEGYLQTLGWNRVTQDLIDTGTYITGRDTDIVDLNGDGRLQPGEVDAVAGTFFGTSNIRQFIDFGPLWLNPAFDLDTGVGTTQLDRRTVFLSDRDIADAETQTAYFDLEHQLDFGTLRFEGFYDAMDAQLYQSYGYAADYISDVYELRASFSGMRDFSSDLSLNGIVGVSYRSYDNTTRQTFLSGYLVTDRRDLSVGPTATDIFDDPFTQEAGSIGWDTDLASEWSNASVFAVTDWSFKDQIDLLVGLRYDFYDVEAINTGETIFDWTLGHTVFSDDDTDFSFETALTWRTGKGIAPYIMYAENSTLETNDAGGISVDRIAQGNFLAESSLAEGGIKFDALNSRIIGSAVYYQQERTRSDAFGNLDAEESEGFELELKALLSETWSFTGAATIQQTRIGAPGVCNGNGEFVVITPARAGLAEVDAYGGIIAALNSSCLTELQQGYERNTLPEQVYSGFFTYTSEPSDYGVYGYTFGGTWVSETGGKTAGAHRLPSNFNMRLAFFWERDNIAVNATVTNALDEEYFIPVQNVYEEVGVLPSKGREFKLAITARF